MRLISMNELQLIFEYMSFLLGMTLGAISGTIFILFLGVLRFRSFPPDLGRTILCAMLFFIPPILGFFCFRASYGIFEFDPLRSLYNLVVELIIWRGGWFFGGAFFGIILILSWFLLSMKMQRDLASNRHAGWTSLRGISLLPR